MLRTAAAETHLVVACLGSGRTRLESRPAPRPEPDEMLLALRMVGLCGTDLFKLAAGHDAPGSVLGHELVGTVTETGAGASGFAPGDRVVVPHHVPCGVCHLCLSGSETMCPAFRENLLQPGGFAERILVKSRAVKLAAKRLPDTLADESAVFMEPAACVLRGIHRAALCDGAAVAVLGAGSMGLLHLLLLKSARPGVRVVVVDPRPDRRNQALKLGAAAACAPGDEARQAVFDHSADRGADAVFDTVGGADVMRAGVELSRHGGSIVLFAHASEGERADFDINSLFKFERRLIGTYSGGLKEQSEVFELLVSGAFDPSPLVSHRLSLEQFDRGLALARQREALKIVFTPVA